MCVCVCVMCAYEYRWAQNIFQFGPIGKTKVKVNVKKRTNKHETQLNRINSNVTRLPGTKNKYMEYKIEEYFMLRLVFM